MAQVAVLPAFAHARANSKLVALVSDDADKRRTLSRRYGIEHVYSYSAFDLGGGTLYDIGVYCINAARYVFRSEPQQVAAFSVHRDGALKGVDESTAAVMRFSGERVAAFVTSFNAADVAEYRIVGTKGHLHVDPAYEYAEGLAYALHVNGKVTRKRLGKRDQFAPELLHFSDCVQRNRQPEPSGEECRARASASPGRESGSRTS